MRPSNQISYVHAPSNPCTNAFPVIVFALHGRFINRAFLSTSHSTIYAIFERVTPDDLETCDQEKEKRRDRAH